MNTRLKTTIGLLLLLAVVVWQAYTPVLLLVVSVFAAIAVWEIATCAKVKNKPLKVISVVFSALFPVFAAPNSLEPIISSTVIEKIINIVPSGAVVCIYLLVLLLVMLKGYSKTKFEHVAIVFTASLAVPYALSCVIHFRDLYLVQPAMFTKEAGIFMLFVGAICAWGTDSGAYLAGKLFGKHKMAPKISPKKTIEGAIGGVIFALALNMAAFGLFYLITKQQPIAWYVVLALSIPLSLLGMMGDLAASVIKRNYGVKDFGKIFPGHGGVMDRFDSALFTFSALYCAIQVYINIANVH